MPSSNCSNSFSKNAKRAQESDYLEFVVQEIESAKPKVDEDVALLSEEKVLSQHEKLLSEVTESIKLLSEDSGADILHTLKRVRAALEAARMIDTRLAPFSERLSAVYFELEDIESSLHEYLAGLQFDAARLEQIEQRLSELQRLKRKYGPQLSDVLTNV